MIPKNITRENIIKAIEIIDQVGIPKGRHSRKFNILMNNRQYPPKYVISLANRFANGFELNPDEFSGGNESNDFLQSLGFKIVSAQANKVPKAITQQETKKAVKKHNERCSECKNVIIEMFRRIYGTVKIDHKIEVPVKLESYINEPYYSDLTRIYKAIVNYRNKKEFIRTNNLHRCDLYVPGDKGFIVEFDESQHFSNARKIALANYPDYLLLGFDSTKWQERCLNINAKDNDPEYRDEQRAWYDTIRDFLPLIKGVAPTVRVFMGDFNWCSLDANNSSDLEYFKRIIEKPPKKNNVTNSISIATVAISSQNHNMEDRTVLLGDVISHLKDQVDIVLFPAGFYNAKEKPASFLYKNILEKIQAINPNTDTIISLGVDGRYGKDQIAVAIHRNRLLAMGRKYHPTINERLYIEKAPTCLSPEENYSRIFEVKGKKLFLAVCYDAFGINQNKLKNPGVDIILNLVHGFYPKGEGNSGDVYFAKNGFAGASKQWKCPVFGTAVFFDREIPERWPTGVLWNKGDMSTTKWKYINNPLSPYKVFEIDTKNEVALVKLYEY